MDANRGQVPSDDFVTAAISRITPTVQRFAVKMIWRAWKQLRTRLQFDRIRRIAKVKHSIFARKVQRAWRRRRCAHCLPCNTLGPNSYQRFESPMVA